MAYIAKHHSKQEREGYCCEIGWIYFFVGWHPVSVYNRLTDNRHLIGLKVSGWRHFFERNRLDLDPELAG